MSAHTGGRAYLLTWLGLLVLTALSFVTNLVELPAATETVIALAIATTKAGAVAVVFMHLKDARFANRATFGTALVFVAILCAFMVADVTTRTTFPPKPLPAAPAAHAQ